MTPPAERAGPVLVIGELLVEIMAEAPGHGFRAPIALTGPYPSGAPAIFVDQLARLGRAVALVGGVGADDFGAAVRDRLTGDGVATGAVAERPDRPTGTAFVRYRPDGARDFVFNIAHSAAGRPDRQAAEPLLAQARHLHVMGSSLGVPALAALNEEAAAAIGARGGTVSVDPNLRKELMSVPAAAALDRIVARADLYMPGEGELESDPEAARAAGPGQVVVKRGARGASLHGPAGRVDAGAVAAEVVDPTGAGDCFDAAFVDAWLAGAEPAAALARANAAGAIATTRRGPMEGVASPEAIAARLAVPRAATVRGPDDGREGDG